MKNLILFSLFCLILAGCSKSDDQRRFEDEAFTGPRGITETDPSGNIVPGREDPGDWNISPMYQLQITVEPAYPNPVDFVSNFTIRIDLKVPDAVNEMVFYSFRFPDELHEPIYEIGPSRMQLFNTVTIPANVIATLGVPGEEYRILVFDGHDNLITYGDVRVE